MFPPEEILQLQKAQCFGSCCVGQTKDRLKYKLLKFILDFTFLSIDLIDLMTDFKSEI